MKIDVTRCAGIMCTVLICIASGACVLWGMAPAAVAMCMLSCKWCKRLTPVYVSCMVGILIVGTGILSLPYSDTYVLDGMTYDGMLFVQKYAGLLAAVLLIVRIAGRQGENENRLKGYVLSVAVICAVNIVSYRDTLAEGLIYGVVEAVAAVCLAVIMSPGMELLLKNNSKDSDKGVSDQYVISVMVMMAICLWTVPDINAYVNTQLIISLIFIVYMVYRAGTAYGFGVAALTGGVLAIRQENMEWLAVMLLITLVMLVGRTFTGRRKSTSILFYMIGVLLAVVACGYVEVGADRWKMIGLAVNFAVPAIVFACIPGKYMSNLCSVPNTACIQAAATEINRMTAARVEDMANTFRRLDYALAGDGDMGISLSQVGDLMDSFRQQICVLGSAAEVTDDRLVEKLQSIGMTDTRVTSAVWKGKRKRFYVAGRTSGQGMVLSRQVAGVLSEYYGRNIRVGIDSPSLFFDEYRTAVYEESAMFKGHYHVRRIKKCGSPVSGDNFSVREYDDGRLVMMLSDGMGSGSLASCESCTLLDTMEEMLEAGFDPEYSIQFANSCMSRRNQGRTFTTFDMVMIDLYNGEMTSYKQGAAVTYIIHPGKDSNSVKGITSTTLPIGVVDNVECDTAKTDLRDGDAVVMVSDGVTDMDVEDRLADILKNIKIYDGKKLVDDILSNIFGDRDAVMRDDVTVMAVVLCAAESCGKIGGNI